jgi:hypothetical protein
MAPFQERARRLDMSFPVTFLVDGSPVKGHCQNVSASGLLGSFLEPPELWTRGDLQLHCGTEVYTLQARVARVEERQAAFSFTFRDDRDRAAIEAVLAFAVEKTALVGRPF